MAKFNLSIDTGNAAFDDTPGTEVARILREIARLVDGESLAGFDRVALHDLNGNKVGEIRVTRR